MVEIQKVDLEAKVENKIINETVWITNVHNRRPVRVGNKVSFRDGNVIWTVVNIHEGVLSFGEIERLWS